MSLVDSRTYLADGGYIQKGAEVNLYESDLSNEVQDLLPSRWYRDENIFQLERHAIFSKVVLLQLVLHGSRLTRFLLVLAYRILHIALSEARRIFDAGYVWMAFFHYQGQGGKYCEQHYVICMP